LKRGDVYWADLAPRSGSKQRGRRPVIVVSHDAFNQTEGWQLVIIVPISTSGSQARRSPTTVLLPSGAGALARASVAVCHQITTLDRAKLTQRIGALPAELLRAVEEGLKAALDLE